MVFQIDDSVRQTLVTLNESNLTIPVVRSTKSGAFDFCNGSVVAANSQLFRPGL